MKILLDTPVKVIAELEPWELQALKLMAQAGERLLDKEYLGPGEYKITYELIHELASILLKAPRYWKGVPITISVNKRTKVSISGPPEWKKKHDSLGNEPKPDGTALPTGPQPQGT